MDKRQESIMAAESAIASSMAACEYWKRMEQDLKRQQEERMTEWKRKTDAWEKLNRNNEIKKYTKEEIDEAIHQLRIERLKELLKDCV